MEITQDVKDLVEISIREDLGQSEINISDFIGDITTQSTIKESETITASMVAREQGVICGVTIAEYVFNRIAPNIDVTIHLQDGVAVNAGDKILTVSGSAQDILQSERIALNFISHLSGIATNTARYVDAVKGTNAKILDTRKTLPGWRGLQKHAVKMGGGENHRMGLYDMVLIKDNHIVAAGGVNEALNRVKTANPDVKIEIEVDTLDQLQDVLDHGTADIVLLDNLRGDDLEQAVQICQGKIITEASGGITLDNIQEIVKKGVDYISIGALTHSVTVFDIGLDS